MKAALILGLLALAADSAIAQTPSPSPAASPSPSPAVNTTATAAVTPSPTPNATLTTAAAAASPEPEAEPEASPSPDLEPVTPAEPGAVVTEPAAPVEPDTDAIQPAASPEPSASEPNATEAVTTATANGTKYPYFSSPLFAIQQIKELSGLANLAKGSEVAKLLSDKKLVATIFAPTSEAVTTAIEFVTNATSADAATLAEMGVVEQLLRYHVTEGAAVLLDRLKNKQKLTMLDGNKTTITIYEPQIYRRLLQADNATDATYFIASDSNQKFEIVDSDIAAGRSIIHIINGVLVPQALLDKYNITNTADLPGADQTTATTSTLVPVPGDTRDTPAAPANTTGGAAKAAATLLAVPALLAAVMF